ncbi:MAG: hypothetical protein H8E32_05100 [Nitrospinae bacterium]|nr:hypothetical protein [Nitrospinota bacterium]
MARKDKEEEPPKRRRKKKRKPPNVEAPVKKPVKKKNSSTLTISVIVAAIALTWAAFPKDEGKEAASSKTVPSVVGVLDQIYLGCTVYWYQKGSQYPCTQEVVDSLYNSKASDIKITVTTKKKKKFSAIGKHVANPIVLKVDFNGDVFIKARDCEFNIDTIDTSDVNLEELEAQCKPSAPAS